MSGRSTADIVADLRTTTMQQSNTWGLRNEAADRLAEIDAELKSACAEIDRLQALNETRPA